MLRGLFCCFTAASCAWGLLPAVPGGCQLCVEAAASCGAGCCQLCVEAAASCGAQASHCSGLSSRRSALGCVGFGRCASWAPGHRLGGCGVWTCPAAFRIFPDQGLNPCLLHWQVDSLPLSHRGSPNPLGKPQCQVFCFVFPLHSFIVVFFECVRTWLLSVTEVR